MSEVPLYVGVSGENTSHLCRLGIVGYFELEAGPSRYGSHIRGPLNSPPSQAQTVAQRLGKRVAQGCFALKKREF